MAWSFAKLRWVHHSPLVESIAAESIPRLGDARTQELANMAWAYSRLEVRACPLLPAISSSSLRRISQF